MVKNMCRVVEMTIDGRTFRVSEIKMKYMQNIVDAAKACEKLIKIQIYANLQQVDNAKVHKHDLLDLVSYALSENVSIVVPGYINKKLQIMRGWNQPADMTRMLQLKQILWLSV